MKTVILDAYTENPGDLSWDWIKELGSELSVYDRTDSSDIVERAKDAEILVTNKCLITREIIEKLPELRYIQVIATGYNVIDTAAAKDNGIIVCNIPSYSTNGVAQLVFSLLLEMTQQVALHSESVHNGEWTSCEHFCYQKTRLTELAGKTIGIIGFGKIGQTVAQIANAFSMNVIAYAPRPKEYSGFGKVEFVSLSELQKSSDIITLHCPLTPETDKLINAEFISQMKDGAYLINTARGAVIDEEAVSCALKSGKLSYFGADVLSCEPPKADNPLIGCKNCIITPHIAWANFEARTRLMNIFKENFKAYLENKPINVVNR
ncbi:MAG: D-2-hydroxyacid dehydrogenase [Acutalibacteraceae bacterium]